MPRTRTILLLSAATLAVATVALVVGLRLARTAVLTDGSTIRVRASGAPARSVLWRPPILVRGLDGIDEDAYEPRASPDGTTLVFVRGRPNSSGSASSGADLCIARWSPTGWTAPAPLTALNSDADELGPEFSPDGASLYFYSDREGGEGGYDLWVAHRDGDSWSAPANLGPSVNTPWNEYAPAIDPATGALYFSSNRPRPGESVRDDDAWPATLRERRHRHDYDLFVTTVGDDGAVMGDASRVDALNSGFDEGAPAISPGGDFLYFASDRDGGSGGFDLYRARLRADGGPDLPESLGSPVNTAANELDPALASDGFRLYFSSDRDREKGALASDARPYALWWTVSREVYGDRDEVDWSWASFLHNLLPWLLAALLVLLAALLLGWLVARADSRERLRRLSLLAKCLLISVFLHFLIATGLAAWTIGNELGEYLRSGGTRVVLASSASLSDVTVQLRDAVAASEPTPIERFVPTEPIAAISLPAPSLADPPSPPEMPTRANVDAALPHTAEVALEAPAIGSAHELPEDASRAPRTPAPDPLDPRVAAREPSAASPASRADLPLTAAPALTPPRLASAPAAPTLPTPKPSDQKLSAAIDAAEVALRAARPIEANSPPALPAPELGDGEPALPHADRAVAPAPAHEPSVRDRAPSRIELPPTAAPTLASGPILATLDAEPLALPARTAPDSRIPPTAPSASASPLRIATALPTLPADDALPNRLPARLPARLPTKPPEPQIASPAPVPVEDFSQRLPESRSELVAEMGGSDETERAVGRALEWLRRHQSPDGRWQSREHEGKVSADAAMTGMALLCFLSAGHTHLEDGPYRETVSRGLAWLRARERPDGDLRVGRGVADADTMYGQTVATVALCEAYAMTRDPALADSVRRAVRFVEDKAADSRGGRASPAETAVLGWLIMTLESARRAGVATDEVSMRAASDWLDRVAERRTPGRYAYRPGATANPEMTAEAMFVRQLLGHSAGEARMRESARFVLERPPRWEEGAPTNHWYYATLALFQHQGDEWKAWNEAIVPELLAHQRTDGDMSGSWDPQDRLSRLCGRVYQTAVCTLSLEVYYRYRLRERPPADSASRR